MKVHRLDPESLAEQTTCILAGATERALAYTFGQGSYGQLAIGVQPELVLQPRPVSVNRSWESAAAGWSAQRIPSTTRKTTRTLINHLQGSSAATSWTVAVVCTCAARTSRGSWELATTRTWPSSHSWERCPPSTRFIARRCLWWLLPGQSRPSSSL